MDGLGGYLAGGCAIAIASVNVWLQWRRWRSVHPRAARSGGRRRGRPS